VANLSETKLVRFLAPNFVNFSISLYWLGTSLEFVFSYYRVACRMH